MNEPRQPTDPISITLEAQQWNTVLGALAEAPWRIADPVIRAIASQTNPPAIADPPAVPARTNGDAREIEDRAAA
jgi:hypothetical protein